jgi:OPA family sugar phosphate sensor protein UhpC-like MFS transporter
MHDTPESKGLPSIEELSGEKAQAEAKVSEADTKAIQLAVIRNPGVWILALSSAFMYISRYAINEWGVIFLQEAKGYDLAEAAAIIGINPIFGIIGTVLSGWLSDAIFKGNRNYPAFAAGVLEAIALALFLFGGPGKVINIIAMVLFGIAIGVLVSFIGGLMAVDLVPRKASGAALGIVGVASYAAAGIQNVVTGILLDGNIVDGVHDFTYASWFWIGAAVISFLLPILNWKRKKQVI